MDSCCGGPLSEDDGVATEAVVDGSVEAFDECSRFFDEIAIVGVVDDVATAVVGLLRFFLIDGCEVVFEIIDKIGRHGVGDEFGSSGWVFQFSEESFCCSDDFPMGVFADAEVGSEAGLFAGDGAGCIGDG